MDTKKTKIAVLGAGPWGTAVASLLSRNNHSVSLWAYQNILDKDIVPDKEILVTDNINDAVKDSEYIFIVLNSQFFISTFNTINDVYLKGKKFIVLTKGLVKLEDTFTLSFKVLTEKYNIPKEHIAVWSGPNIAPEIYKDIPASAVFASSNLSLAEEFKSIVSSQVFKVITSLDPTGVQWSGILKNPVAIMAGICDGLYKDSSSNTKSSLITFALEDMKKIGEYFGAKKETFDSLAGIGDLITTCFAGRNRQVGINLALGKTVAEIYDMYKPQVPEGIEQLKIIMHLIKDNVDAPVFFALNDIVFNGSDPKASLLSLF